MADQKISELTALTGANVADDDAIAIVDTSATETKKIVFSELKNALDTATGFVRITGDTMTGALDVQSTITADGLTVDGVETPTISLTDSSTSKNLLVRVDNSGGEIRTSTTANDDLRLATNGVQRLRLEHNGDISFYEDTGTTAKFFWSASDERLGIGTSSPSANLEIAQSGNNVGLLVAGGGYNYTAKFESSDAEANIIIEDSNSTNDGNMIGVATNDMYFITNASERMRITSSGSVGIGTSSPNSKLTLSTGDKIFVPTGEALNFGHTTGSANTERMRIDSSGNLLVNTTDTAPADNNVEGAAVIGGGQLQVSKDGATVAKFNRKGLDGDILRFNKNGALVGSIQARGGDLVIGTTDTGIRFNDANNALQPHHATDVTDGTIDLGLSGQRFKDLHLSGSIEIENGTRNVGVGKEALNSNTGDRNTALGYRAGYANIGGYRNVYIGELAGNTNQTGNENVYVGRYAGSDTTGSNNTFIGQSAGYTITTGSENTIIGAYNGNQGGLDIRTSSNNIVLSDGDGNWRFRSNSSGHLFGPGIYTNTTSSSANVVVQYSTGDITRSTSSRRYKNSIQDSTAGLAELNTLRPVSFKGNNDGDIVFNGLIAEEVHDAGLTQFVEYDEENRPDALRYPHMVSLCIKAIQELSAKNDALEARITALENA